MLLFVCLMAYSNMSGQLVKITKKEKVGIEKSVFYPVLNEKGDKLLYTDVNYKGLKLYDLTNNKLTPISDADGAGFEPLFESKTGNILHRETRFVDRRKYQSVQRYNPVNKQRSVLIQSTRNLKSTLPPAARTAARTETDIRVYSNAQSVIVSVNGIEKELKPIDETAVSGYIWASLSPDKKRMLFYATGKGTYIADLNGNPISYLGNLQAPRWYNDNQVVGMDARNNEYVYTSSRILMVAADGKTKQYLTDDNEMAMYPSASAVSGKIAYNTYEGDIFILTVNPVK